MNPEPEKCFMCDKPIVEEHGLCCSYECYLEYMEREEFPDEKLRYDPDEERYV